MAAQAEIAVDWSGLLESATREVFSMMLGCEIEVESAPGKIENYQEGLPGNSAQPPLIEVLFQREMHAGKPEGNLEVTAVVGIAGELCGAVSFACGNAAARMMAARMLGVEETCVGDQQWDAIGEICNMVAGNFKSKLPGIGERTMLSVPTIVVGSSYRLRTLARRRKMECRFRVNGAPAGISVELQP